MTKAELEKQVKENQTFIDGLLLISKKQNKCIDKISDRVIEVEKKLNKSNAVYGGSK